MNDTFPFQVEPLPYTYDGLEPELCKDILLFHHDKHYKAYVDQLNSILSDFPKLQSMTLEDLIIHLDELPEDIQTSIRNQAGGVYNHQLYFRCMQGDLRILRKGIPAQLPSLLPHHSPASVFLQQPLCGQQKNGQKHTGAYEDQVPAPFVFPAVLVLHVCSVGSLLMPLPSHTGGCRRSRRS